MRTPTIPQGSASQFSKSRLDAVLSQARCLASAVRIGELKCRTLVTAPPSHAGARPAPFPRRWSTDVGAMTVRLITARLDADVDQVVGELGVAVTTTTWSNSRPLARWMFSHTIVRSSRSSHRTNAYSSIS